MEHSDKREAVLLAAMELVGEHGFHGSPMALIAEQAGVAAGTIYRFFDSKDTLIKEIHATLVFGPNGRLAGSRNGAQVPGQLGRGVVSARYSLVQAPVLAIYAVPSSVATFLPFVDWNDATQARKARRNFDDWIRGTGAERERLTGALPAAQVVSLVGAHHYVFLSHPDTTQALMEAFLERH
jgi:AcrR family transcriptional regulator